MTAQEIADRYRKSSYPEPLKTQKAQALAIRSNVSWEQVQAILDAGKADA